MIGFHWRNNNKTRLIGILEVEEKKESLLSATRTGNWRLGGNSADPAKTRLRLSWLDILITNMAALPAMRPLGCLRSLVQASAPMQPFINRRFISTAYSKRPERVPLPPNMPEQFLSQIPLRFRPDPGMSCSIEWKSTRALLIAAISCRAPAPQDLPCSAFCSQSMQGPHRSGYRIAIGSPRPHGWAQGNVRLPTKPAQCQDRRYRTSDIQERRPIQRNCSQHQVARNRNIFPHA